MSRRDTARLVIAKVIADTLATDVDVVMQRIDAAYPFGQRRHHPYKIWLEERSKARAALLAKANPHDPSVRKCPACGAKPGRPCIEVDFGRRFERAEHHASRLAGAGSGPLFGGAS